MAPAIDGHVEPEENHQRRKHRSGDPKALVPVDPIGPNQPALDNQQHQPRREHQAVHRQQRKQLGRRVDRLEK